MKYRVKEEYIFTQWQHLGSLWSKTLTLLKDSELAIARPTKVNVSSMTCRRVSQ